MDITVSGRHAEITDHFREYVEEKTRAKVEKYAPKTQAVEVKLTRYRDRKGNAVDRGKIEMTLIGPGPIVRAEAEGTEKYSGFDICLDKLVERMRRAKDRRASHRDGRGNSLHDMSALGFAPAAVQPASHEAITGSIPIVPTHEDATTDERDPAPVNDYVDIEAEADETEAPFMIREKVFPPQTLSAAEAVDHMELVGHDFFLFVEAETNRPAVVYRRKGWDYGVIALEAS